jgi:hypothetical protein
MQVALLPSRLLCYCENSKHGDEDTRQRESSLHMIVHLLPPSMRLKEAQSADWMLLTVVLPAEKEFAAMLYLHPMPRLPGFPVDRVMSQHAMQFQQGRLSHLS